MGNLAHALRTDGEGKVSLSVVVDACNMVQAAMNDSSDKVRNFALCQRDGGNSISRVLILNEGSGKLDTRCWTLG